jgi:hypothetical protein
MAPVAFRDRLLTAIRRQKDEAHVSPRGPRSSCCAPAVRRSSWQATTQGSRLEIRDLIRGDRGWCAAEGLKAVDLSKALDEVEALANRHYH